MNRIGRPYVFTAFDAVCIVGPMLSLIINACSDVSLEAHECAGERMTGARRPTSVQCMRRDATPKGT